MEKNTKSIPTSPSVARVGHWGVADANEARQIGSGAQDGLLARPVSLVDSQMPLSLVGPGEPPVAFGALERFLTSVRSSVGGKVVRAGEALAAAVPVANERSVTGMNPHVPGQLIRPRERALTAQERAFVHLPALQ